MLKPFVFITKPIPEEIEAFIGEHCCYEIWQEDTLPNDVLFEKLKDAEGLLTSGTSGPSINRELLEHAPKLKVVSNQSVGYDNFDIEAMKERSVVGTHTPYTLDDTVADLAFSLILSSARRVAELDRFVRAGKWGTVEEEALFGIDVHHQTLGIIGMGRIGEQAARRAKFGFDMDVLYHNRHRKQEIEDSIGVKYAELDTLLEQSDFILLITPLTDETYHMIGEREFKKMKDSAIFVNISRGKTVDEKALIRALQEGWIRGAGLDVYEEEPVAKDNPLLKLDNVTLLPHIGSATAKVRFNMCKQAAENMVSAIQGNTPKNLTREFQ
ncbi:2-hydroxyacid dehydrogenase [Bacillus inaquosorum]|uniref:2-hydroxyacid dehydrogenase n=1 Tax=Bacillus inaquosorum TaxID=483913 RepID=UPI00228323A1|nr:D-glycerate dehydrogenase [Bacillus inaquosorum]MCY7786312.1 D-glycerate dehydrogenase [Bacillus inaquosorum]